MLSLHQWLRALTARRGVSTRRSRSSLAARTAARLGCESLEGRTLLSTGVRPIDEVGNNLINTTWGSPGTDLIRITPAQYGDGVSTPSGADRPSARAISDVVVAHPSAEVKNDRALSNFVYAWGQFIDHDLDQTTSSAGAAAFNIAVPTGDPQFDPTSTGTQVIGLRRSNFDPSTGTSASNPRQQVNNITAYLDGSMVYGSDATRAAALRSFSGGKLKTGAGGLLPLNDTTLPMDNATRQTPDNQLFLAGDVRANENIELTALQTLFMREHNRIADSIAKAHPSMSDEAIYQQARAQVIGEIESITYNEFLPALLGPNALPAYQGYNPAVNAAISNEFSTAAFRFGHSMLGNDVEFLDDQGNTVRPAISLKDAFFNPDMVKTAGIDPLLKYLASDNAEEVDVKVVDSLRNFLFGAPGQGGLDLPSLNIQRGRDHGLADYNTTRVALGLPQSQTFADITSDPTLQAQLKAVYGDVNKVDLWVGGLAENHVPGGSLGPTFTRIVVDQFERTRAGDRFWFESKFSGRALSQLEHTTLADVIRANTGLKNIQENVFVFQTGISGKVFADGNRDGQARPGEPGIAGRTVDLLDSTGATVASTVTDSQGMYHFAQVGLGTFTVAEAALSGVLPTTPASRTVAITRGMVVDHQDLGEAVASPPRHPAPPPRQQHANHNPPPLANPAPPWPVSGSQSVKRVVGGNHFNRRPWSRPTG